jgi:cell wall-associated NlpC family hydrolase
MHGIDLKRDASQQALQGIPIVDLKQILPGDLAFFSNAEGKVVHVGILINTGQIIHASGKVKIDSFDEKGIYSEESKRYTHNFHSIMRHEKLAL